MENDAGITPQEYAKPMEQPGNPPFAGHPGKGHLFFNQDHPRGHMGCLRFGQPGRSNFTCFPDESYTSPACCPRSRPRHSTFPDLGFVRAPDLVVDMPSPPK